VGGGGGVGFVDFGGLVVGRHVGGDEDGRRRLHALMSEDRLEGHVGILVCWPYCISCFKYFLVSQTYEAYIPIRLLVHNTLDPKRVEE
jgi:hypothetical protein